jgi:S-adenosylmethionine-diacylgycerolhomoserine-N-methlytransferase
MDGVYRYQRHIYNLTRKYYLFGRDRLIRQLGLKPGERAVEVGCGTARNLILMAKAYPDARLFGLDASREMLRTASEAAARADVLNRMTLAYGLAEEMTPGLFAIEGKFDHAIFSYSLSMIPDWRNALRVAARNVAPDGTIHIVDFGDFTRLPRPIACALASWLWRFHVQPRRNLLRLLEMNRERSGYVLQILPGRYAFVLRCSPAHILSLPLESVAD